MGCHLKPVCVCGSDNVIRILYGYLSPSQDDLVKKGEIIDGGCVPEMDDPIWYCKHCHNKWGTMKKELRFN